MPDSEAPEKTKDDKPNIRLQDWKEVIEKDFPPVREPTDDELIDQIMRRSPHRSRPIHPGAERWRRD